MFIWNKALWFLWFCPQIFRKRSPFCFWFCKYKSPLSSKGNWYFQHPKTFAWSVLAPRDGHNQCQQSLKKRCSWQSLDGTHVMAGISSNLQFCQEHQRLLTQCAPCGGKKMCIWAAISRACLVEVFQKAIAFCILAVWFFLFFWRASFSPGSHGRQKYHCKDCRGNGFCAHGRRKFNCSRCKAKLAAVKSVKGCCRVLPGCSWFHCAWQGKIYPFVANPCKTMQWLPYSSHFGRGSLLSHLECWSQTCKMKTHFNFYILCQILPVYHLRFIQKVYWWK